MWHIVITICYCCYIFSINIISAHLLSSLTHRNSLYKVVSSPINHLLSIIYSYFLIAFCISCLDISPRKCLFHVMMPCLLANSFILADTKIAVFVQIQFFCFRYYTIKEGNEKSSHLGLSEYDLILYVIKQRRK